MYSYSDLILDIEKLNSLGVETGKIGKTELGVDIPYAFVGKKGGAYILVTGATHAREHITAQLVIQQAFYYHENNVNLNGGIYFVPMLNIDGVRLCQEGVKFIGDEGKRKFLLKTNGGSEDFSFWKANANAVDINTNFDAHWGTGQQNIFFPAPFNYVGKAPMSESETQAIADFTKKITADYAITYHTKGEIIYWQYFQQNMQKWRDYRYARYVSKYTGYRLMSQTNSAGGYKDWCVEKLKIPAITVEVGSDKFGYPFPYSQLNDILQKNLLVPQKMLNTVAKDKQNGKKVYESGDGGSGESGG